MPSNLLPWLYFTLTCLMDLQSALVCWPGVPALEKEHNTCLWPVWSHREKKYAVGVSFRVWKAVWFSLRREEKVYINKNGNLSRNPNHTDSSANIHVKSVWCSLSFLPFITFNIDIFNVIHHSVWASWFFFFFLT